MLIATNRPVNSRQSGNALQKQGDTSTSEDLFRKTFQNGFNLMKATDSESNMDLSPNIHKQPLLIDNEYQCGDESDEMEYSL